MVTTTAAAAVALSVWLPTGVSLLLFFPAVFGSWGTTGFGLAFSFPAFFFLLTWDWLAFCSIPLVCFWNAAFGSGFGILDGSFWREGERDGKDSWGNTTHNYWSVWVFDSRGIRYTWLSHTFFFELRDSDGFSHLTRLLCEVSLRSVLWFSLVLSFVSSTHQTPLHFTLPSLLASVLTKLLPNSLLPYYYYSLIRLSRYCHRGGVRVTSK